MRGDAAALVVGDAAVAIDDMIYMNFLLLLLQRAGNVLLEIDMYSVLILVDGRENVGCARRNQTSLRCVVKVDIEGHSLGHAGTILQPIYIYIRDNLKIFKSYN